MIDKPAFFKTAIVTGACSGMGLALTRHLLAKADTSDEIWRVVLADVNQAGYDKIKDSLDTDRTTFVRVDVSKWEDQVQLFKQAFEWSGGRVDFLACNAGISDREPLLGWLGKSSPEFEDDGLSFGDEKELKAPNMLCMDIDLTSLFYSMKLFTHITRKTRRAIERRPLARDFLPKMVITSSIAGQYPFYITPMYTAAKHGALGLVRAAAPTIFEDEQIALNAILPGTVRTEIIPAPILEQWPESRFTPMSNIIRAFDELINEKGAVVQDGNSDGVNGQIKNGCAVECSAEKIYYRDAVPFCDDVQDWVVNQSRREGILGQHIVKMHA